MACLPSPCNWYKRHAAFLTLDCINLTYTRLVFLYSQNSGKKEKTGTGEDGEVDVVSVEELNQKISILEKEKNKEEEYRNYMQLERVSGAG